MSLTGIIKNAFRAGMFALTVATASMTVSSCASTIPQTQRISAEWYKEIVRNNFGEQQKKENQETVEDIVNDINDDMLGMNSEEFLRYMKVTNSANLETNIRNFQRYPLELLEESNRNILDLEYKKDLPLALVFMAVYDHTDNALGIRALDVKPKELMKLTEGYKVIIFEYKDKEEIQEQLELIRKKFPEKGRVEGLIVAGHGNGQEIKSGEYNKGEYIRTIDIHETFKPHMDLFDKEAIVFLSSCYGGIELEDPHAANMAESFSHTFIGKKIYACDGELVNFKFKLDEEGKVKQESLKLYALGPTAWPFVNCTYVAQTNSEKEAYSAMFANYLGDLGIEMWQELVKEVGEKELVEEIRQFTKKSQIYDLAMNYKNVKTMWSKDYNLEAKDVAEYVGVSLLELLKGRVTALTCQKIFPERKEMKTALDQGTCQYHFRSVDEPEKTWQVKLEPETQTEATRKPKFVWKSK